MNGAEPGRSFRRLFTPPLAACTAALVVAFTTLPAASQAAGDMKTFANAQYGLAVSLPSGCRYDEGPGTIDAICSPGLDSEKSTTIDKLSAFVLQVSAEAAPPEDAGKTANELAQRYGEAVFKAELPEAVCGESDTGRVKVADVKSILEETRVVYTADVTCSEVKFLQVGERRAAVNYMIAPDARYRLVARALAEDFEKHRSVIDAFFASFRVGPK
jgi:hypothetical protein